MRVFAVICLILLTVLLLQCSYDSGRQEHSESLVTDTIFEDIQDRLAAIEKCGSCHESEYDNWLKGPHANAYKGLIEHIQYVDSSPNFSSIYKEFTSTQAKILCTSCHTGQNLYETVFVGASSEQDQNRLTQEYYPKLLTRAPVSRPTDDAVGLSTGIDCLTCHKSGNHVVTNDGFQTRPAQKKEGQCRPVGSKLFSSALNCYTCHFAQVSSMQRLIAEGHLEKEVNCSGSCHQEMDENGRGTHYFYWRKDAIDKIRPSVLNPFQGISVHIEEIDSDFTLKFCWENDHIPHDFSECGEAVADVTLFDRSGNVMVRFSELLNRKNQFEGHRFEHFKDGMAGYQYVMGELPLIKDLPLKMNPKGGKIVIIGRVKPQYWSSEEEFEQVYTEEISL